MPRKHDKDQLRDLYVNKGYSAKQIAEELGISEKATQSVLYRDGFKKNKTRKQEEPQNNLLSKYNVTERELESILKGLKNPLPEQKQIEIDKQRVRYGVISDTHIGSIYYDSNLMSRAADVFNKSNLDFVVHVGDIIEGHYESHRPGHVFELSHIGGDNQIKYAAEELKKIDSNIPLYFITGNHENNTFYKLTGFEIGKTLEKLLPNSTFLGNAEGEINLPYNQKIMLMHPDGGSCFDDKTEILTENGWKLFKDLRPMEKVATLNEKKEKLEWQEPIHYTDEEYEGNMYHFLARSFDLFVTPNHRLLVRRYPQGLFRKDNLKYPQKSHKRINLKWEGKTAEELKDCKRQEYQMRRGNVYWEGKLIEKITIPYREPKKYASTKIKHIGKLNIDDVAELIAWYVTEGYICKKRKQLNICQSQRVNPENHQQIIDLFKRIGFYPNVRGIDKKDIVVCSVELCEWLIDECGSLSVNKYLPKWLKEQPTDILEIVFDTMIKGDGWINGEGFGYKSISKRLLEDVTEIGLKLGYGATTNKDSVNFSRVQVMPTINNKPEIKKYKGRVYCVQVPNDTILVRRNGKIIWSKNSYAISYRSQKIAESLDGGKKPSVLHIGHFHKAEYLFYRNIHIMQAGCLQSQSKFMKGKHISAHKGFWVVDLDTSKEGVKRILPEFYSEY